MNQKYGICGTFDFNGMNTGGQSVKTKEFYFGLSEVVGKQSIYVLESTRYKRHPISFFFRFIRMVRNCDNSVIFPAQNGIKILAPLSVIFKRGKKVHYNVIGGWLPQMLGHDRKLLFFLKKFDSILVETNAMKIALNELGLKKLYRLLNFKRLTVVEKTKKCIKPIKLCYFSRIVRQKGVEDAVQVVKEINKNGIKCVFDIYGPIVDGYNAEFENLKSSFTSEIAYRGVVDSSQSISVLKDYDIQLFPTLFKTEGIPGSIVDSYFAGVPVVASRWNSFDDVVKEGITGVGFELGNKKDFYTVLNDLVEHPVYIDTMKQNCVLESENYSPRKVISDFLAITERK